MSLVILLSLFGLFVSQSFSINLREEIIKNKGIIKRNLQHMVHKTKETKTHHNMRWTSLSGNKHKQRKEDGRPATNNWR